MQKNDISGSGIRALNIILLESDFKRENTIEYNPEKIKNHINIDVSHEIKDNHIYITETIHFEQLAGSKKQITSKITMLGLFERFGESSVSLDEFGKINGPAIIFPFIREQLASLTLKSGIGQILLPPLNFIKKNEESK
jgi:preprotein translocase subunit SecB